jgi:hypothetical protein
MYVYVCMYVCMYVCIHAYIVHYTDTRLENEEINDNMKR